MSDWKYKSSRDLADDQIFYRDRVKCTICGLTIEVYQKSGEFPLFLDPGQFTPHLYVIYKHADWLPYAMDGKTASSGERES